MAAALDDVTPFGNFDYVIVGAGSAGCVLANRLSADPKVRVLLLEAGGSDKRFWVHVPVGYLYTMGHAELDWCMKTEAEPGLNGRAIAYPRGKVLGGCSSINGMIYMRGQAQDYDVWRQKGNVGWGWDDVLPYFRKSERHYGPSSEFHSSEGEMYVEKQRLHWPILDAVREAANELKIPSTEDFNLGDNEGVGYFAVNQRAGLRWNARKAFLDPVRKRANLQIVPGAEVERLVLTGRRASDVLFSKGGQRYRVEASAEIVLAAGAMGTSKILELSGIGSGSVLSSNGIDVLHELPGVGENLQDHLQIRMVFGISGARTLNDMSKGVLGKARIAAEYVLRRSGPMAMAPSQLGIFTRSAPEFESANIEYHVQPLSLDSFGQPLHEFPALTVSICNLRPASRGSSHVRSGHFSDAPMIQPNYLSAPEDRTVAVDSIRHARSLMATERLRRYQPAELKPGPSVASDAELINAAGDIATTIFHPVGTARMGGDAMAVVAPDLRVHGIDGLSIADASVMPQIISGNTHAPVTMIAEKASDMIINRRAAA